MQSLTLRSPAKINLFLFITGRYPNGYHRILTLFHRISLSDSLHLRKAASGFKLNCSNPKVPSDGRNLVARADTMLRRKFPRLGGVRVRLKKRIPAGGGLGGGSSNAAFYLLGMKKLYRLPLSKKNLLNMGKKLGADVPFFLLNVNQALGKGRGDELRVKKTKRRKWFVLGLFKRSLSTARVYQNLPRRLPAVSLTNRNRIVRIASPLTGPQGLKQTAEAFQNHLEMPACRLFPSIARVMTRMAHQGASFVRMSGSGPTVFALLIDRKTAQKFARSMRHDYPSMQWFVCHSV